MTKLNSRRDGGARGLAATFMALVLLAMPAAALAQGTRIEMPSNRYDIREDVQAGQQASVEVERQLPILRDQEIEGYVNSLGQRLVSSIPQQFQHPQFRYHFRVVNARDLNAFALPGGPMYINRGMIEAARSEGELAGVMSHEISHIALRHATAQATKGQKYQIGSILGQIAGAVIGGVPGAVIGQGSQVITGLKQLQYSREYETQADILGSQIMARAGYDPRDLANVFRTIQSQSGGRGGPEWMSSHPDPGNRYQRINQEAQLLRVSNEYAARDSREFQRIQSRLRSGGRAPSMEEIARGQGGSQQDTRYPQQDPRYPDQGGTYGRVPYPSGRYVTVGDNQTFRMSVPDNWRQFGQGNSVMYVPEGGYGNQGITHGVIVGRDREQYTDLNRAAQQYVNELLQANSYLRAQGGFRRQAISRREALAITLLGRSPVTGRNEQVIVFVTSMRNGDIFYVNAVAPQNEYRNYERTFIDIINSIQLGD
ncbi:MAG TPA: M48 family metallopeptidase [Pyrinomonadaceae bacterium]|nr:M48 family metallopeptidase [Pyrinomonadaceae bacterium]